MAEMALQEWIMLFLHTDWVTKCIIHNILGLQLCSREQIKIYMDQLGRMVCPASCIRIYMDQLHAGLGT
jgi:hypothetical protein